MKIIRKEGQSKLVEDHNGQRYFLPIWSDDLSLAVIADLWSQLVRPELATFLRKQKIYGYEDLIKHPELAQITLNYGIDYYELLSKAKELNNAS